MNNREWHQQMEQRRRGERMERWLLTALVSLGVLVGGYFIASTIAGAFQSAADQIEAASNPNR